VSLVALVSMLVPALPASASANSTPNIVTFRAVLCFAPNLRVKSAFPSAAALPTCTPKYELTAKNLGVVPNGSVDGFKANTVKLDPRFRDFRSTPHGEVLAMSDVLLPGIKGAGSGGRFVLGPAKLTSSAIKSAKAVKEHLGAWVVDYRLTAPGSVAWDAFAKSQFHAYIAIVADGEVYSAPLIQPEERKFTSFDGSGEISGSFTKTEALDLAKWMQPKN
jgi:preprotein translocase subunit SecD